MLLLPNLIFSSEFHPVAEEQNASIVDMSFVFLTPSQTFESGQNSLVNIICLFALA